LDIGKRIIKQVVLSVRGGKFTLSRGHTNKTATESPHMQLLLLQWSKQTLLQHLEGGTHFDPRICG